MPYIRHYYFKENNIIKLQQHTLKIYDMTRLIVFSTFLFCINVKAQTIDSTIYLCKYSYIWQKDSTNPANKFVDFFYLEVSPKSSKYYSYLKQLGLKNAAYDLASNKSLDEMVKNQANYFGNCESEIIIYNYLDKKIKVIDQPGVNSYFYIEPLTTPQWEIKNDTTTILYQLCQKATCNFKGRSYIAWFAPSIPYNLGPWQFIGLPGLILKISDIKNQFVFECTNLINKPKIRPYFKEYALAKKIAKEKLRELKRLREVSYYDFKKLDEPDITVTFTNKNGVVGPMPKSKPKPYNPIDLSK